MVMGELEISPQRKWYSTTKESVGYYPRKKKKTKAYLSVQTKNMEMFSDGELQNSFMFASLDSCSKAEWNGKTFV